MENLKIAIIATGIGFKRFMNDIMLPTGPQLNKIEFVKVENYEQAQGHRFHSFILHYSSRDINDQNLKDLIKLVQWRQVKFK